MQYSASENIVQAEKGIVRGAAKVYAQSGARAPTKGAVAVDWSGVYGGCRIITGFLDERGRVRAVWAYRHVDAEEGTRRVRVRGARWAVPDARRHSCRAVTEFRMRPFSVMPRSVALKPGRPLPQAYRHGARMLRLAR